MFEKVCYALGGLDGRYHQKVRIHISKIDFIPGIADELCQEHPLRSAVSFSKRMQSIGNAIKINNLLHELVMAQPLEIVAVSKAFKNQLGLTFNALGRSKLRTFFANIHRADFARPFIQIR